MEHSWQTLLHNGHSYIMDTPSPHPGSLSSLDSKLRHSDFTLLLSRVGSMRLEIIEFNAWGSERL